MTWFYSSIGLRSPEQQGFLLCILVAFCLGWTVHGIVTDRRYRRWREAFRRGARVRVGR